MRSTNQILPLLYKNRLNALSILSFPKSFFKRYFLPARGVSMMIPSSSSSSSSSLEMQTSLRGFTLVFVAPKKMMGQAVKTKRAFEVMSFWKMDERAATNWNHR